MLKEGTFKLGKLKIGTLLLERYAKRRNVEIRKTQNRNIAFRKIFNVP